MQDSALRHYGGFVLAGASALAVDLAVLKALTAIGLDPLLGRLASIAVAMVVSWLINRRVTFAVTAAPSLKEFAAFAGVSWFAQAANYAVFAAILVARPETAPTVAVILACAVSMLFAYAGFRFGVFRAAPQPKPDRTT
jgi:putative flippase GtrA